MVKNLSNYSIREETEADKKQMILILRLLILKKARKEALNKLYTNNGVLNARCFNSTHQYSLDEFTKMVRDRFGENRFDDFFN